MSNFNNQDNFNFEELKLPLQYNSPFDDYITIKKSEDISTIKERKSYSK